MMYQPPIGARDLLPIDVAQKQWIEHRLKRVFHAWSYQRIITPTLERLETLVAGGAVRPERVIQVWDAEDGILGLRPELTASIARAVVTRSSEATLPRRLYYIANIFRRQVRAGSQHEFYQAGVELLGASSAMADVEVLQLLAEGLASIGLADCHLVLGDAGLTRSLLADFPAPLRTQMRESIARLDRVAIEEMSLDADLKRRAMQLLDLRGEPASVLQKIAQWPLGPAQMAVVQRLKTVVDLLTGYPSITLDLSLIQTFDYYTGIVFEVISHSASGQRVLAQGGRYDQLLGLYHPQGEQIPGVGFSLNVQDIQQVLLPLDLLPQMMPPSDWLVVAESPQAMQATLSHAAQLRNADEVRVELELELRSPELVRRHAQSRRIPKIAWVSGAGSVTIEELPPS